MDITSLILFFLPSIKIYNMKPTKNQIFCKDCGKTKMLFESEKKADTFIKFNSDNIRQENGYSPIRSYFCVFCAGWHVTSKKEFFKSNSGIENPVETYMYNLEVKLKAKKNIQIEKKLIEKKDQLAYVITLKEVSKLEKQIISMNKEKLCSDVRFELIDNVFFNSITIKDIRRVQKRKTYFEMKLRNQKSELLHWKNYIFAS